jgi:hypothetical protein
VTGPATHNLVGTRLIEERLGVPAKNARTDAAGLAAVVRTACERAGALRPRAAAATAEAAG